MKGTTSWITTIARPLAAAAVTALLASGCDGGGAATSAPATAPAASHAPAPASGPVVSEGVRRRAREAFATVCATCHGTEGKGNGPGAAGLEPKPRAFGDLTWQKSVTDEHIEKTIVFGGAAVGKSANMPAHPVYKDNAPMRAALREIVRGFGQQGEKPAAQ